MDETVEGAATEELLLQGPFRNNDGLCWDARLPLSLAAWADTDSLSTRSPFILREDGRPLGPPHVRHAEIAAKGEGRFSHYGGSVYFASADNSDPNANGRRYTLHAAPEAPAAAMAALDAEVTLAAEAGRAAHSLVGGSAFGQRPEVTGCAGLVTIHSASYSGSTLINAVLGTHPEFFAGGELHLAVTAPATAGVCAICGKGCPFWTPEFRAGLAHAEFYHPVARHFGRALVCDSSKSPEWFNPVLPHYPDLPQSRVLVVKHPVRHVASHLQKYRLGELDERFRDPDAILFHLRSLYQRFQGDTEFDVVLRYEDLVADLEAAMNRILAPLGRGWVPGMAAWQAAENHMLGGNAGPRSQITGKPQADPALARKYARKAVFLDNSYAEQLTLEELGTILRHPDARWIMAEYGYR